MEYFDQKNIKYFYYEELDGVTWQEQNMTATEHDSSRAW
jgi:hypothetical protein